MTVQYSSLYVELDGLLDTRLATLLLMGEDKALDAVKAGYLTRDLEEFPVSMTDWRKRYAQRDRFTLKESGVTKLMTALKEFVLATRHTADTPYPIEPKIYLNIYPYKLLDEEIKNIVQMVAIALNGQCDIEVLDLPPEEITPTYVKQTFSVMYMYRGIDWLEHHAQSEAFKQSTCPEVCLFVPAIYFNGRPSKSALDEAERLKMPAFKVVEQAAAPLIMLRFIPSGDFSIALTS